MRTISIHRIDAVQLLERCVVLYLVALLFFYPYGIGAGGNSLRVPDIIGGLALLIGIACVCIRGRLRGVFLVFVPLLPFLVMEIGTPILGAATVGPMTAAFSGVRMALIWLPLLLLAWVATIDTAGRMDVKFRRVLKLALYANVVYALVQQLYMLGILPEVVVITRHLQPFAVDGHHHLMQGFRSSGFFVNTTELSVFGIVCISYFWARYISNRQVGDLYLALLGMLAVVLTTSRAAMFAGVLIFVVGWAYLSLQRKAVFATVASAFLVFVMVGVDRLIGLDAFFYRFQRLAEFGLVGDDSFAMRLEGNWPEVLQEMVHYPVGTLVSSPSVFRLIDSGYLTYFAQGKWVFLATLAIVLIAMVVVGLNLKRARAQWARLLLLFLAVFLAGTMIISNPMRSPVMIFFITYGFWLLHYQKVQRRQRVATSEAVETGSTSG